MNPVYEQDCWVWQHNRNGCYSVKSSYWYRLTRVNDIRQAKTKPSLNDLKMAAWKIEAPPKIKLSFWRALNKDIPAGKLP